MSTEIPVLLKKGGATTKKEKDSYNQNFYRLKGTVRPDQIGLRMVTLDWKGFWEDYLPQYVTIIYNFDLEFFQRHFKPIGIKKSIQSPTYLGACITPAEL